MGLASSHVIGGVQPGDVLSPPVQVFPAEAVFAGELGLDLGLGIGDCDANFQPAVGLIAEEDIEKLNKPFYSTKVKGVGLGLALSFRIVKENHRGEISVKSKPGKWTTFTVNLPE